MHCKVISSVAVALLCFISYSCKKENMCDCVKTTGKIVTQTRAVSGFTCIHLEDKIDLYMSQGPAFDLKVEAGEHLQSLIKTELDGETLKVVNHNRCNWVRGYKHPIKVYVTAPYYKYIGNWGVGNIETSGIIAQDTIRCKTYSSGDIHLSLSCKAIFCSTHGNGDIYLQGTTDELQNDYVGTNFLYASNLEVNNYIYLHSASIGNAYINAPYNGLMDIRLETSGNVYYSGNPSTINLTRDGKGELIRQ